MHTRVSSRQIEIDTVSKLTVPPHENCKLPFEESPISSTLALATATTLICRMKDMRQRRVDILQETKTHVTVLMSAFLERYIFAWRMQLRKVMTVANRRN